MKHKVSDLEGALLDAAVAKAEGFALRRHPAGFDLWCRPDDPQFSEAVEPGYWLGDESFRTIIERERIAVYFQTGVGMENDFENEWVAGTGLSLETTPEYDSGGGFPFIDFDHSAAGPTPLIAAMRAFVASKLGEEVEL